MKRFLAFFLSLILFSVVFACTAAANESNPVYAHAEYSRDGDIISVKLSLRDIRDEVGIVCVDFTFIYNTDDYEFSSADVAFPEKWQPFAESENAESLSHLLLDNNGNPSGGYNWSLVMITPGNGITGDDELSCIVHFKVKGEKLSDIVIEAGSVANDNGTRLKCNSPVVCPENGSVVDNPSSAPDTSSKIESNGDQENTNGSAAGTSRVEGSVEPSAESGSKTTVIIIGSIAVGAAILAAVIVILRRKGHTK